MIAGGPQVAGGTEEAVKSVFDLTLEDNLTMSFKAFPSNLKANIFSKPAAEDLVAKMGDLSVRVVCRTKLTAPSAAPWCCAIERMFEEN